MMIRLEDIARVTHEANRAYCQTRGDDSQLPWADAPAWQKDSALNGVRFHVEHPNAGPHGSHGNWMKEKLAAGWIYGPVKDIEKKTHPCILAYDALPLEQQIKDHIFVGIVRAMTCEGDHA